MPLYHFSCPTCGEEVSRLLKREREVHCKKDGCTLVRKPQGPTSQVVERLDGPFMVKAVERLADAERLHRERSKLAP